MSKQCWLQSHEEETNTAECSLIKKKKKEMASCTQTPSLKLLVLLNTNVHTKQKAIDCQSNQEKEKRNGFLYTNTQFEATGST